MILGRWSAHRGFNVGVFIMLRARDTPRPETMNLACHFSATRIAI